MNVGRIVTTMYPIRSWRVKSAISGRCWPICMANLPSILPAARGDGLRSSSRKAVLLESELILHLPCCGSRHGKIRFVNVLLKQPARVCRYPAQRSISQYARLLWGMSPTWVAWQKN